MKKVALVVMLLSASAFGAVTLTAPSSVDPAAGGLTYTVDVGLANVATDQAMVVGFDLYANTANPAQFKVSRTFLADAVTAGLGGTPAVPTISGTQLTASTPNFGGITDLAATVPDGKIVTVVFTVAAPLTAPATIDWSGLWVDGNTIDTGGTFGARTVLNVVPEPVSALLLGLGSLFLVRRRRA